MNFLSTLSDIKKDSNIKIDTVSSKNNVGKSFIDVYREMKEAPVNKTNQSKVSTAFIKK